MGPLWVSADVDPDHVNDQAEEVMQALVNALRERMTAAGVNPSKTPYGTVTAHRFDMRRIRDSPLMYETCDANPDMVRFAVDYQPPA